MEKSRSHAALGQPLEQALIGTTAETTTSNAGCATLPAKAASLGCRKSALLAFFTVKAFGIDAASRLLATQCLAAHNFARSVGVIETAAYELRTVLRSSA